MTVIIADPHQSSHPVTDAETREAPAVDRACGPLLAVERLYW
jgi:hypothetical protein